jgi:hypothetical protein
MRVEPDPEERANHQIAPARDVEKGIFKRRDRLDCRMVLESAPRV